MKMAELPLARDFPAADKAAWQALVEKALKGAPLSSLESKSYDDIVIEPLYGPATGADVIPGRAPGTPWEVMQRIEIADGKTANSQILEDLNNGANSLALVFQGSVGDYGYGLPPSEVMLKDAFKDVHLDWGIAVELQLGPLCKDAALMLANMVHMIDIPPSDVNIRFGFDPIGVLAANGWNNIVWPDMAPVFASLLMELKSQGFAGPFAVGDGRPVHAAGGSEAQELAFALSTALAYVRAAHDGGVPLDDARRLIFFRLAADQNQFLTTAKFRALRKLWSRVEEACGLEPETTFVTAETAWRMMTKRDPHGNIVRGNGAAHDVSMRVALGHHAPCRLGGDEGSLRLQPAGFLHTRPQLAQGSELRGGEELVLVGRQAEEDETPRIVERHATVMGGTDISERGGQREGEFLRFRAAGRMHGPTIADGERSGEALALQLHEQGCEHRRHVGPNDVVPAIGGEHADGIEAEADVHVAWWDVDHMHHVGEHESRIFAERA